MALCMNMQGKQRMHFAIPKVYSGWLALVLQDGASEITETKMMARFSHLHLLIF